MNKRLSTRDLAEFLANQTGLDQKRADEFLKTFISYITSGIERNKFVKVWGLGTFKVVLVRERESVHIQTGERFVIPAHHKLSFIPNKDFKEHINRPFAFFEPIETTTIEHKPEKITFNKDIDYKNTDQTINELVDDYNPAVVFDGSDNIEPEQLFEHLPEEEANDSVVSEENEIILPEQIIEVPNDESGGGIAINEEDEYIISEQVFDTENEQEFELQETQEAALNEYLEEEFGNQEVALNEYLEEESGNQEAVLDEYIEEEPDIEGDNSVKYTDEKNNYDDIDYRQSSDYKKEANKKSIPLWLWFLSMPLLVATGFGIARYVFFNYDSERTSSDQYMTILGRQNNNVNNSPSPLGSFTLPDNNLEGTNQSELISDYLSDSISIINEKRAVDSVTNATDKKDNKVRDWLSAIPDDNSKAETKRVTKPNEKIESMNRELGRNVGTQKPATTTNAAKTPVNESTTANTNTEKIVPERIRLTAGSSLMQLALEYYGDKVFWVYIYDYNKSKIKDFDNIPLDTELRLPLPKTYDINAKSQSSVEKARRKQSELLGGRQ